MRDGSVGSIPGWYPDPGGQHDLRFHNGVNWTGDVSTDGERHVAPLPSPEGSDGRTHSPDPGEASGTAPLVLGIIALCIAWIPFISVVGAGVAIAAILLGVRRRRIPSARSASNAGIVMGAVGLAFAVLGTWLAVIVLDEIRRYDDPGPYEVSDLVCEEIDGVTRASGSISNRSGTERSYTIEVTFDGERSGSTDVDAVEPGSTAAFVVDEDLRFADLTCEVVDVNGPIPFGLDVGW